jgi:hypothetical protein
VQRERGVLAPAPGQRERQRTGSRDRGRGFNMKRTFSVIERGPWARRGSSSAPHSAHPAAKALTGSPQRGHLWGVRMRQAYPGWVNEG